VSPLASILLIIIGAAVLGALLYWQLVIAEGSYLGRRVVIWLYDITARRYDSIKNYHPDAESAFLGEPLAAALAAWPAPLVLDVGTGTGRLPRTLLEQPRFMGRVVGLDLSRRMLEIAARQTARYGRQIDLIWHDACCLPFCDGAFDAVCCLEVLEFTPDPERQIAELVRVTRPGGYLLTTRRRGWNARMLPGKTHSQATLREALLTAGLARVEFIRWQVDYDLVWGIRAGAEPPAAHHLLDVLQCPACSHTGWEDSGHVLHCTACGARYRICDDIIEMAG
jgi:ubiquinone/menaquinone biosynthesis C-methylase UbiE